VDKDTVYEDKYFKVINPDSPLNCRDDGGHLILTKKKQVTDRSDLTLQEAVDYMRISMAVGKAMYDVLGVERMNYEDLGNWGVDAPGGAKMHLHFMGRAHEQTHQIRGHHIALFPNGHKIYDGHLKRLTEDQITSLRNRVEEILREPKYLKMAEIAQL